MNLTALTTRIIIERVEGSKTTAGGIVLQRSLDQTTRGRVLSVGPRVMNEVKVGDEVVVDWNRVAHMRHNDQDYFTVDIQDVLAVYED